MPRNHTLSFFFLGLALILPGSALAGATASSELKDSWGEASKTNAQSVVDGDPATAWVEGGENDGTGEWIELDIPRGTLTSFTVIVGKGPDQETFQRYARPKQIDVDIFSLDDSQSPVQVKQVTHTFEDKYGPVTIEVGEQQIGEELWGGKAKFTIRSVFPGTDFDTLTAISEIQATFKEQDAFSVVIELSSNEGHKERLVDKKNSTAWVAASGAEEWVTVEANDWSISSIGIFPGNASSSSNFKAYSRPKTVEITVNMETFTHELEDKKEMQWIPFPARGGYNGSAYGEVRIQVQDVYPGSSKSEVAISEIMLRAINYGG